MSDDEITIEVVSDCRFISSEIQKLENILGFKVKVNPFLDNCTFIITFNEPIEDFPEIVDSSYDNLRFLRKRKKGKYKKYS